MLLSKKKRQQYLKELGFYKGEIDGKIGPLTKKAYKDLQNKYFYRGKDKDGLYGSNTDTLLKCAYNCKDLAHFKLEEFKCKCKGFCTGYPTELNKDFLSYLDETRKHFNKAMKVTSGLRCKTHNKNVGGISNSKHLKGKAADCYVNDYSSLNKRKEVINYWIDEFKNSNYAYCNGYFKNKKTSGYVQAPNMGSEVHLDTK